MALLKEMPIGWEGWVLMTSTKFHTWEKSIDSNAEVHNESINRTTGKIKRISETHVLVLQAGLRPNMLNQELLIKQY